MKTVHEVSALTGVSIRALHHYDRIGLLKPTAVSDAGYRLYDESALVRLQCIMLYRTLEFPLKDIKAILDSPAFDRNRALDQQIYVLGCSPARDEKASYVAYGHSILTDPWGSVVCELGAEEGMLFAQIDPERVDRVRRQIPLGG
jgi:DNA-binding transcriptional MerR regulator